MRLALTVALCSLWMACPKSFEAKNPPCGDNSGCTVEVLGNDFPDHVCSRDYTCVPKSSVVPDTGGAAAVYDAGFTNRDAAAPQCRSDQDCDEGEFCDRGSCFQFDSPRRFVDGGFADGGLAAKSDAAIGDTSPPIRSDSGVVNPSDTGGRPEAPEDGGEPAQNDSGGRDED